MQLKQVKEKIRSVDTRVQELFHQLIADNQMTKNYNTDWTIRDVLAHIVWYEEEMALVMENQSILDSSPIWNNPLDKRNELITETMSGVISTVLLDRHKHASSNLLSALDHLTDNHMIDSSLFVGMPSEWVPWQILAGSSFKHNMDHIKELEKWLVQQN